MFVDPALALAAVGEAHHQAGVALARLRAVDTGGWQGPAATAWADARAAAVVTAHAVTEELHAVHERVRAFAAECDAWSGRLR